VKSLENDEMKLNHKYENSLQALRMLRGKKICEKIKNSPTENQRNNYALTLSQYAREDAVCAYKTNNSLSKFNKYIKTL